VRWLVVLALLAGCKKEEAAPKGPEPMSQAERDRGEDACRAYVKRLCSCAAPKDSQELKDRCELHKGRPDTIATALATEGGTEVSGMDVLQAQDAARKVMAACVRDLVDLDQAGCP
jgi:hypothetical protein